MDPAPRLACQQCKRRKMRCDKGSPCSACRAAGLRCHVVQRARLPRGKSGKTRNKSALLEARLSRIEEMMSQQEAGAQGSLRSPDEEAGFQGPSRPGNWIGGLVAPEFWTTLSQEVQGLRETLEASDDEDEQGADEATPASHRPEQYLGAGAIVFRQNPHQDNAPELPVPTPEIRTALLNLYRERVDKLYKVLHWPTTRSAIEAAYAKPEGKLSRSEKALEYAIYFVSLCTTTDGEAKTLGLGSRKELIRQYRAAVEVLLARTSLLVCPDITTLQAFVMYLLALRNQINGGLIWTLTALAVRAAESLRLGEEDPKAFSRFDLELRRRLLFIVGSIDTFAALDRGTAPKMPSSAFRNPPLDINDDEMSPAYTPATSSTYFTDMSFASMIHQGMVCQRKMYELCTNTQCAWLHWDEKLDILSSWEQYAAQRLAEVSDSSPPLRRFQKHISRLITESLRFMLRRPSAQQAREVVPPWDDFDVMAASAEVLREHVIIAKSPDFAPWSWKTCVPWSALAIILIELCSRPWSAASDRAYTIAVESFGDIAHKIPDSEAGMLWKPIAKLMRQADRVRSGAMNAPMAKVVDCALPPFANRETPDKLDCMARLGIRDLPFDFGQAFEVDHNGALDITPGDGENHTAQVLSDIQLDLDASWGHWDLSLPPLN